MQTMHDMFNHLFHTAEPGKDSSLKWPVDEGNLFYIELAVLNRGPGIIIKSEIDEAECREVTIKRLQEGISGSLAGKTVELVNPDDWKTVAAQYANEFIDHVFSFKEKAVDESKECFAVKYDDEVYVVMISVVPYTEVHSVMTIN